MKTHQNQTDLLSLNQGLYNRISVNKYQQHIPGQILCKRCLSCRLHWLLSPSQTRYCNLFNQVFSSEHKPL